MDEKWSRLALIVEKSILFPQNFPLSKNGNANKNGSKIATKQKATLPFHKRATRDRFGYLSLLNGLGFTGNTRGDGNGHSRSQRRVWRIHDRTIDWLIEMRGRKRAWLKQPKRSMSMWCNKNKNAPATATAIPGVTRNWYTAELSKPFTSIWYFLEAKIFHNWHSCARV
jgi:hypothetical protein